MPSGHGNTPGRRRMLDRVPEKIRNFGEHLRPHSFRRGSRSPSPAPSSPPGRIPPPEVAGTPSPVGPPAPNHESASFTTFTTLPRTLSPFEIRQRTADLLKGRLTPEEVEKLKLDETTPGQARAIVEGVRKSLEGRPEHTRKIYKALQYINNYSKIIDVAIQHQPCITALVWGGMRTIIQLALNRYETYECLDQALQAITTTMTNCAFYHGLYRSFAQSPKSTTLGYDKETFGALEAQLPQLYAAVIELSVKASKYWNRRSIAHSYKQLFQPFSIKFKPLLDEIMEREKALRELATGAAMVEILENSGRLRGWDERSRELNTMMGATLANTYNIYDKLCKMISVQDKETLIKCRKWLDSMEDMDSEYNKNRSLLLEGTCGWILKTEEFKALMNFKQQQHLWVHGNPGAGKSVLAAFVITEMRKRPDTDLQVLYSFCRYGSNCMPNSSARAIVSNLIDQLMERKPLRSLLEILDVARGKHAKTEKCGDFAVLWDIFVAMVRVFPTPIIVVVDALDECQVGRKEFLEGLVSFPGSKVRFFLTSRKELDIEDVLDRCPSIAKRPMDVEADIEKFVVWRVEQLPRLHNFKTQVIKAATEYSSGMFRYAALLIDEVNSPDAISDIPVMLHRPPADLNQMYDNILLRLESTETGAKKQKSIEIRRKILTWVGMAKRPLRADELAFACAVGEEEENIDPTQRALFSEQELLRKCGPLVEIDDSIVQYTHFTVREYLSQSSSGIYHIQEERAHASIAMTSIALLRSRNIPDAKPGLPKFYYFIEYWLYHASNVATETKETSTPSKLSEVALEFFRDRNAFQSWATRVSGEYIDNRYVASKPQPLHIAAAYGLLGLARLLVNGGADVSAANSKGETPLLEASYGGHEGVVQLLIEHGANASAADSERRTPLYWASCGGNEMVVRLLIDNGADVSAADSEGKTPVYWASRGGHEGVVRRLINNGADISAANNKGETPLLEASYGGHGGVVQLLMDKGADVSAADSEGRTPLYWASCRGHEGVVRLLLRDKSVNASAADSEGKTPLYWASCGGNEMVVRLLIDNGADVSAADSEGKTPLYWASYRGHEGVARLLIGKGADVSAADSEGRTPLYWASCGGHEGVVQLLVDNGANASAADGEGKTPLYWASYMGREGMVQKLIDKGADVSAADDKGKTPLYWASKLGRDEIVRLLIDKGAKASAANSEGKAPLHCASNRGHEGVVRPLIGKGANNSAANNEGKTPLHCATRNGHEEVAGLLVDNGATSPTTSKQGATLLTAARAPQQDHRAINCGPERQ